MNSSNILHPNEISRKWIDEPADAGVAAADIHPPEELCFLNGKAMDVGEHLKYGRILPIM